MPQIRVSALLFFTLAIVTSPMVTGVVERLVALLVAGTTIFIAWSDSAVVKSNVTDSAIIATEAMQAITKKKSFFMLG